MKALRDRKYFLAIGHYTSHAQRVFIRLGARVHEEHASQSIGCNVKQFLGSPGAHVKRQHDVIQSVRAELELLRSGAESKSRLEREQHEEQLAGLSRQIEDLESAQAQKEREFNATLAERDESAAPLEGNLSVAKLARTHAENQAKRLNSGLASSAPRRMLPVRGASASTRLITIKTAEA